MENQIDSKVVEDHVESPFVVTNPPAKGIVIRDFNAFLSLSPAAMRLIPQVLRADYTYWCVLNTERIAEKVYGEYTRNTGTYVRSGIRELVEKNFIAKSDRVDMYWINLNMIA